MAAVVGEALPRSARSRSGVEFFPDASRWTYRDAGSSISLNFAEFEGVAEPLLRSLKKTLIWYVRHKSGHHAKGMFSRLLHFVRYVTANAEVLEEFTAAAFLNYRGSLEPGKQWYSSSLAGALRKWHQLGHTGLSTDLVGLLRQVRLRGNRKGEAVRLACPVRGPLSDLEFDRLVASLNTARESGKLELAGYLIVWLSACLGLRPLQLAQLKIKDLVAPTATTPFLLRVPRVKQRAAGPRTLMKPRPILHAVGILLEEQQRSVWSRFASQSLDLPLFPAAEETEWVVGFEWHATAVAMATKLSQAVNSLSVVSERTGKPLHVTSRRLRSSLGTRAAQEGHGALVIAELLDHTDTQNVLVYTQARPEILDRLDEALAMKLAPLAQAFAGRLATAEEMSFPAGGVVRGAVAHNAVVGSCGTGSPCRLVPPIACYTCGQFRPWRDAPHTELLATLVAERERLSHSCDRRIAAVKDRTILAIAEVVRRCEAASPREDQ